MKGGGEYGTADGHSVEEPAADATEASGLSSVLALLDGEICQKFKYSAIVDAFAGPGAYLDGPDGSPVVIARTFLHHSRRERFQQLRLICLEERKDRRDFLEGRLAALPQLPRLEVMV